MWKRWIVMALLNKSNVLWAVLAVIATDGIGCSQGQCANPLANGEELRLDGRVSPGADGTASLTLDLHNDGDHAVHCLELPWERCSERNFVILTDGAPARGFEIFQAFGNSAVLSSEIPRGSAREGIVRITELGSGRHELIGLLPCRIHDVAAGHGSGTMTLNLVVGPITFQTGTNRARGHAK